MHNFPSVVCLNEYGDVKFRCIIRGSSAWVYVNKLGSRCSATFERYGVFYPSCHTLVLILHDIRINMRRLGVKLGTILTKVSVRCFVPCSCQRSQSLFPLFFMHRASLRLAQRQKVEHERWKIQPFRFTPWLAGPFPKPACGCEGGTKWAANGCVLNSWTFLLMRNF